MEALGSEEHCNYSSPVVLDCKEPESHKYMKAHELTMLHISSCENLKNVSPKYPTVHTTLIKSSLDVTTGTAIKSAKR